MIIYIFIHIYYLTFPLGNHLSYILKQKILVPSSVLTAVVRKSLPAKQWLTETRRVSAVKCENSCPVEYSDGCCKTIAACETVVDKLDGFLLLNVIILVPSSILTAVVRQLLPAKQWLTETLPVLYYQFVM
jgi:hypothetical protein